MADSQLAPIAIVGMSCRLPGDVDSPGDFWKMLCRARSGWSKVPSDRFNADAYNHPNPDKKGCFNSKGGYFIKQDLSMFDASFFDITKKEAESMDPAQRLLLECTYEALENAGIPKEKVAGKKVGVFVGGNYNEHRTGNLRDLDTIPSFDATGNQGAFQAGRIAYYFDLRGPTFTIDTACSSSMHALHLAVQSIRSGESEQAIVGASHLITQPDIWVSMGKLRLFSDNGRTYAFDHRAKSGYARGEGAACLMLKPLDKAIADNDHIRAVITHTGISHNGRTVGIVAPSPEEQEQLLRDVFAQAKIDPNDVGFFEAHGTGTKKGDPIEATAIYKAVGSLRSADDPLWIGSTKPNVGHLECASGIVSVIKSVLQLYYGFVLPNADFQRVNPAIPLEKWNMRIPHTQLPWPSRKKYTCVNNFGFSGSNATAVLSAAPQARSLELSSNATYTALRLFVLSANDETALKKSMSRLGIFLEQHAELYQSTMPRNLAYTLCQRRSHLPWRVALVAGMCSGLAGALNSHDVSPMRATSDKPKLAFVFTGQGAQWWGMGRELLQSHPVFADAIMRADTALRAIGSEFSVLEELKRDSKTTKVGMAHISQPICSAVQLALVDLLRSFGIAPAAVTGHSSGEIGAAYAAGALDFESAMAAAYYRGQAIVELKRVHAALKGSMMAVGAGADELTPMLKKMFEEDGSKAVVACENSPSSTTLSGDEAAIDQLATAFQEQGTFNRKLFVDVAYHSHHMRLISDFYLNKISSIELQKTPSDVQFFSSLRGRRIELSELGPQYWVDNLTEAVRFSTSLQQMCHEFGPDVLVEIGPHAALKGPIMQTLKKVGTAAGKISYMSTLVRDKDATRTLLELAGQLFMRGYTGLDFYNVNHRREEIEKPDLIPTLFSYPWTRQRYWTESRINMQHRLKAGVRNDLLGTLADWSSDLEPTWRNIIRTSDLPWLRDFCVQGRAVFPVAGFVSMVIEAASQRATTKGFEASSCGFTVKNLKVVEQMFLEDETDVEVLLTLRAAEGASDVEDEFRIVSHEPKRGWQEHCRGAVCVEGSTLKAVGRMPTTQPLSIHSGAIARVVSGDSTQLPMELSSDSASSKVPSSASSDAGWGPENHTPATEFEVQTMDKLELNKSHPITASGPDFYKSLDTIGVTYPQGFQSIMAYTASETEASANCRPKNASRDMPSEFESPYRVHPSVLDSMLQLPLLSLHAGLNSETRVGTYLPCSIKELYMSPGFGKKPAESFYAHSSTELKTGTFMVEVFPSTASIAASLSISGLELKPMQGAPAEYATPRELCFKVEWQPVAAGVESTKESVNRLGSGCEVVVVTERENAEMDVFVKSITEALELQTGIRPLVRSLRNVDNFSSHFLVLSEMETPILSSITPDGFEQVKKLLTQSAGVMWVTRGASKNPTNPNGNMALGLVRTARSEREAVASTLDLDPASRLDVRGQAEMVKEAFVLSVLSGSPNAEMEFAEDQGQLVVPRIVGDDEMNLDVHREMGPSMPYQQAFHQPGRQLQLVSKQNVSQEEVSFEDRPEAPLGHDEIEIMVAASTISVDDLAEFQDGCSSARTAASVARGCSGAVTRVGSSVRQFSVGDRVCAMTEGAFGTHARARVTSTSQIPSDMDLDAAAAVPAAYATAYHALVEVAHVQPCERVLVQISGPTGLAAMEVARHLGADVFALIQTTNESEAARKLGVAGHHVVDARSIYLRRQLEEASGGDGMDVVLTSSSDDKTKAGECLAEFGRFVEIRETCTSAPRAMPKLGTNATFTSVDMASLAIVRPKVVEKAMRAVMEKIATGDVRPSVDPCIFAVSDLSRALQLVRDGAVNPVVVAAGIDEEVKASHRKTTNIFRADGTHIIVGGTGGLGRSMAKWMIEHGAKTIVLLSRSGGAQDKFQRLVNDTRRGDVRIMVQKCDVTSESQVREWLKDHTPSLPAVCGVIHSAMVLRDGLLEDMSHDAYEEVIRPKVQGTWNLHNALVEIGASLDYFVALSSAAGVLGSRGQSAYAAANTFLDAFMQYRMRQGLPGVALDLTAVTGAGYLAENADREADIIRNFGNETVSEEEVLALLSAAVRGTYSAPQCLTGLQLHMSAGGSWPYYASDPRFTQLKEEAIERAKKEGQNVAENAVSAGEAFRMAKTDEEAVQVAGQGILQKLSEVLTIDMENLDAARNITAYGLDSLTAIELRNWIAKELRANLQILELLSSGSVNDLSALIVKKIKGGA